MLIQCIDDLFEEVQKGCLVSNKAAPQRCSMQLCNLEARAPNFTAQLSDLQLQHSGGTPEFDRVLGRAAQPQSSLHSSGTFVRDFAPLELQSDLVI